MPRNGEIAQGLRQEFWRLLKKHGHGGLVPVYKEHGVFTFDYYVNPPGSTEDGTEQILAPIQTDGSALSGGAGPSVFRRQAQ